MEQMLKKSTVQTTQRVLNVQEECPISGEYVLPEYMSDVAVILKCFAYPRLQSRQWSGDQLLVDGNAIIRILYLDEERQCVRSLEFAQPFSCAVRGAVSMDVGVQISMGTKYVNCRAVGPRRIEVRGAVIVSVQAEASVPWEVGTPLEWDGLQVLTEKAEVTIPICAVDKVLSINESLEFDCTLPPAEMLLGGECNAVIKECKLLAGKAIVKGNIYIRQLYTDSKEGTHTHHLNYVLPYSQILDANGIREGMPCKATVQVLSDTERCVVGPDGENTVLEVSVKVLLQLQVYDRAEIELLRDAYHCRFPVVTQTEERAWVNFVAQRFEETKMALRVPMQTGRWNELLDVWVLPFEGECCCAEGRAVLKGRLQIGAIARDTDDEIVCQETFEDYVVEYPFCGNAAEVCPAVVDVHYRVSEDALELQVVLGVDVIENQHEYKEVVTGIQAREDAPYPHESIGALFYYAEQGESIWDIARACHASPRSIKEENELDLDVLRENRVLVVPIDY